MTMHLSIVVPAYNEEKHIVACLRSLKEACAEALPADARWELLVTDNNSTDRTAELARAEGATVVFEPVNQIARARNRGAAEASGEWLLFVDADSEVDAGIIRDTWAAMQRPEVAGGGSLVRYPGRSPVWVSAAIWVWSRLSIWNRWAAGSYLFCRREIFEEVGGFNEEFYASEEIHLSQALKRAARKRHQRLVILRDHPLLTSDRKVGLYGTVGMLKQVGRLLLNPRRGLRDPKTCSMWYDGRR